MRTWLGVSLAAANTGAALAEMERLEHILIMLKAQLADQVRLGN